MFSSCTGTAVHRQESVSDFIVTFFTVTAQKFVYVVLIRATSELTPSRLRNFLTCCLTFFLFSPPLFVHKGTWQWGWFFEFCVSCDLDAGFFGYVAFSAVDFGGNILTAFSASRSIGKLENPFAPWKSFAPWETVRTVPSLHFEPSGLHVHGPILSL